MKNPKARVLIFGILLSIVPSFATSAPSEPLDPTCRVVVEARDNYDHAYRASQPAHPFWIWKGRTGIGRVCVFRKTFTLDALPAEANLSVAFDGEVDVAVNGQPVCRATKVPAHNYNLKASKRDLPMTEFPIRLIDIGSFLRKGENALEIRAVSNAAVGLLAFVEGQGGKLRLVSNATWQAACEEVGRRADWSAAEVRQGMGSLPYNLPVRGVNYENPPLPDYLRVWPVNPAKIALAEIGKGSIVDPENLLAVDGKPATITIPDESRRLLQEASVKEKLAKCQWPITPVCGYPQRINDQDPLAALKAVCPALVFDFGREVHGRLQMASLAKGDVDVLVNFGESPGEATYLPNLGTQWRTISAGTTVEFPETGFRYVKVWFIDSKGNTPIAMDGIKLNFVHYPVQYVGAFHSSDPRLDRIWESGAYTAHLVMQEGIWDGIKRDRSTWADCLYYVARTNYYVFGDAFIPEHSMNSIPRMNGDRLASPVNGFVGHTAWLLRSYCDYYRFTGNFQYISENRRVINSLLEMMRTRFFDGDHALFTNPKKDKIHIDCVAPYVDKDNKNLQMGIHMILFGAFRDGAWLLRAIGDEAAVAKSQEIDNWCEKMKQAATAEWFNAESGIFGKDSQAIEQVNALAIYTGLANREQAKSILNCLLKRPWAKGHEVSPMGMMYINEAMMQESVEDIQTALASLRDYYGTLLDRGLTTFPESDFVHKRAAGEIPGFGPDWAQAFNFYGGSLNHGTSAHPPSFLGRYVLGIYPTTPGFSSCEIKPRLGDLEWVEGSAPTPHGRIQVRHENGKEGFTSRISLPKDISATVLLPARNGQQPVLIVNGKTVPPSQTGDGLVRYCIKPSVDTSKTL